MRTREEHQQDVADQTRLFDKVANLFDARCAVDPSIITFARLPFTLVLRRNRCLLLFQQGSGRTIGFGQVRWHSKWPFDPAAIRSTELWVLRSKSSPMMFQLNDGPAHDLDSIARDVVDMFLGHTGRSGFRLDDPSARAARLAVRSRAAGATAG